MSKRPRPWGRTYRLLALSGGLLAPAPSLAAGLGEGADLSVSWWRVGGALLLCLALALAAALLLKLRMAGGDVSSFGRLWPQGVLATAKLLGRSDRRLRVVETLRLSHQLEVCLVSYDEVEFAIAAGPNGAFLLASKPRPRAADTGGDQAESARP